MGGNGDAAHSLSCLATSSHGFWAIIIRFSVGSLKYRDFSAKTESCGVVIPVRLQKPSSTSLSQMGRPCGVAMWRFLR